MANNGAQSFRLLVADQNLNPLIGGSNITITTDEGELTGTTNYTFPDVFTRGPIEIFFVLSDSSGTDTDPAAPATLTIDVTWKGITTTQLFSGTVD